MSTTAHAEGVRMRARKNDDPSVDAIMRHRNARRAYDALCIDDNEGANAATRLAEFASEGTLYAALTTPPVTPAGAAELVSVIVGVIEEGEDAWACLGLNTLSQGLAAMSAPATRAK